LSHFVTFLRAQKGNLKRAGANNFLKIHLHSVAREELVTLKQLPALPLHSGEFFIRKLFDAFF
jgi:hypothetical protein